MTIADQALAYVRDGQVLGLGTGRAATAFVEALGQRVQAGLHVRGVPTSQATAELARKLGIPLTTLADVAELDIGVLIFVLKWRKRNRCGTPVQQCVEKPIARD